MMWAFPKLSSFFMAQFQVHQLFLLILLSLFLLHFIISSLLFLIVEMPCQKIEEILSKENQISFLVLNKYVLELLNRS